MDSNTLRHSLRRVASNYRWTWSPASRRLIDSLPGAAPGVHPVEVVSRLTDEELESLSEDHDLMGLLNAELVDLEELIHSAREPIIAYCSPEFGVSAATPQYAGGLGVLAGDHLKAASDMGLPLVGVGLLYREGVFRQVLVDGHQTDVHHEVVPEALGASDTGVVIEVPFPGRDVSARVWRLDVGRIPLILLDTDVAANSDQDRAITDRLYQGSRQHRADQEMVLGIGGARALSALGWDIAVHHLNEGHAGFIVLELIDRLISEGDLERALERVRPGMVFTTHTPVPAGIDRFDRELILPYLEEWAKRWSVPVQEIWALGEDPKDPERFNMAALCLRTAGDANGVSELHGEVSRGLFAGVGIGDRIGSVTNGVHARTWTADHVQEVFDQVLGSGWAEGEEEAWDRAGTISDDQLIELRRRGSIRLAEMISLRTKHRLDPDALVLGFARRFAPYKRATLMLKEGDRLRALLADDDRPVHFVFAGKAHPSDQIGKSLVAEVVTFGESAESHGRFTFIPDYDMEVAHALVQGCDIWLNNPIRPREASGTSGEKAVLNGCLNCSILDGWWAEMYDGQNGWAIAPDQHHDVEARDAAEASALLDAIETICVEYFDARPVFNGRIRHAWKTLGPRVTAARMLREYQDRIYLPALERMGR